ncbi:MAG: exodeoxyribonuclease VII small subunit [Luteolibacter sp.]|uniref:exodeoxyribonuclease VII small subunit n=1 Tax=Luteolibacter sp. TaxID=1962973 RepID=UPI0032659769
MARRKTDVEGGDTAPPSFEDALAGLEAIVEAMEHEHLTLEELVAHYEKGSTYLTRCESILQSARGRIELITLRNQNEIALDADAKSAESPGLPTPDDSPDDPDDDDNDIRLF